jgi:hypothetical protein
MANLTGARFRVLINYYRTKYPTAAERLAVLRADFIAAVEEAEKRGGKTLTTTGADGVNSGWQIGMTLEERNDALSQVLDHFEGRSSNKGRVRL